MEILLIRHGLPIRIESDGPVDPPLAPEGHAQAAALARWLRATPPDVVVSSTMSRAIDTARHLTDAFAIEGRRDADLCEFDRGANVYIPLEQLGPDDPHMVRLIEDWFGPAGAARRAVFQQRVVTALGRFVTAPDVADAARCAVVCHGGVVNAVLASVLGTD
ncbi:MAG: histidine phosphatase family protein, partial [Actinobacteria bacterium]|nr:histidine phosphatase family protein [Actinomycetota bacterium]